MQETRKTLKQQARKARAKALIALEAGDWQTYIKLSREALDYEDQLLASYGVKANTGGNEHAT